MKKRKAGVADRRVKAGVCRPRVRLSVSSRSKRASIAGKGAPKNVDEYLARVPGVAQSRFNEMRGIVRSAVPAEAVEVISYGIPAFKTKRVLVWYAAFSRHCSLFPTAAVIEEFRDELGEIKTSKGTVQFSMDKPLPTALIKKLVKARVAQV
jgi:uncharacterized protein YdhG (YjbR/CyaY superfamily)